MGLYLECNDSNDEASGEEAKGDEEPNDAPDCAKNL